MPSLALTPRGHLLFTGADDVLRPSAALSRSVESAFARGSGHGLLELGAAQVGTTLPADFSYWRDFAARFVTTICTHSDLDAHGAPVPAPALDELEALAAAAPPMTGAEYITASVLETLWTEIVAAFRSELAESKASVQDFLQRKSPAWHLVGRVHFNLAENRRDDEAPFAFLATYTTQLSTQARAQHLPLGRALNCPCLAVNGLALSIGAYGVTSPPAAGAPVGLGGTAGVLIGRLLIVYCADTTNRTRHPIFERQTFDAIEFRDVVRHQPEPEAACVSGNEEIVGADHLASFLQVSTDLRVVGGSVVWKIEDCDVRKKGLEGGVVLRSARRHFNTVEQFRLGNHRYTHVGDRHGAQSLEDSLTRAFHDVGARVGVEHVSSHQGSRSWAGRSSTFVMNPSDATGPFSRYDSQSVGRGDRMTSSPSLRMNTSSVSN